MLILPLRSIFKATWAVCVYVLKHGLKNAILLAYGLLESEERGADEKLVPWTQQVLMVLM